MQIRIDQTSRVDMHAHYYGGGLAAALADRTVTPYLRTAADGSRFMGAMNGEFPFTAQYDDPQIVLQDMARAGITHRLMTFPGALGVDLLPAKEVGPAISAFNDHLADLFDRTRKAAFLIAHQVALPACKIEPAEGFIRRRGAKVPADGVQDHPVLVRVGMFGRNGSHN